jgi:hypothetical protein
MMNLSRARCVGHVAHKGDMRNAYKVLVRKYGGKSPLGRPKNRWDDIKINMKGIGCFDMTNFIWLWIQARGRVLRT